jgi:hypothetical protein
MKRTRPQTTGTPHRENVRGGMVKLHAFLTSALEGREWVPDGRVAKKKKNPCLYRESNPGRPALS